jgi:hypothetical protein
MLLSASRQRRLSGVRGTGSALGGRSFLERRACRRVGLSIARLGLSTRLCCFGVEVGAVQEIAADIEVKGSRKVGNCPLGIYF